MITVALDAMGGDFGPRATVPAAVQALSVMPELKIILVGDHSSISNELVTHSKYAQPLIDSHRLVIQHADAVISNLDKPSAVLRGRENSSMHQSISLVKDDVAQACVSAGNTGALMALSRIILKMLPGIERPALISSLPTQNQNKVWMLDLGANISVSGETLFQFAIMGSALAEQHLSSAPRVAILNVGEESIKGNVAVKKCAELLQKTEKINYIGYIEGNQLLEDVADVVVCDGFVGNICLKTTEGVANLFIEKLYLHLNRSIISRLIAKLFLSGLISDLKALNPDQYNGASLLGLRGIVIKSHGSADKTAIINAIAEAVHEVRRQIPSRINECLETVLLERQQ
jgi:glycerol-3-phosphate acyltransferase PlsX